MSLIALSHSRFSELQKTAISNPTYQAYQETTMIRSKNFFILLSLLLTSVSCTSDISPILIIGASGAIGTQLTKKLLDEGHQVVAGLRRTAMPDDLANHPNLTSGTYARRQDGKMARTPSSQ